MENAPRTPTMHAALWAAAAAVAALGTAELAAGIVQSWRSPVVAVAESVIDRSPSAFTRFGIRTFGTNDKAALIIGILLILAVVAPLLGVAARRRPWAGVAGFALFGVVGAAASIDGGPTAAAVPAVLAALIGAGTMLVAFRPRSGERRIPSDAGVGRREMLAGAGALTALGLVMAAGGRALRDRFSAAASRAALVLPGARRPLPPAPAGASFEGIAGLSPLFTPNDRFYRIDTALLIPQVPVEDWTLRVHGMVDEPFEIGFDELTSLGLVETDITLTCVSNRLGGDLVGNARWLGVPLRLLLERAGVQDRADQIVGRSVDGYTCGFPVEAAFDRDALVAVGMNGEPLPLQHGFPARLVTPGLYGYVSATKWLSEIELTRFDTFDQYWVPRGYAERAPIKTMSRIDVPRSGQIVDAGDTVIAGVAWAQTRGISKVEVSIDDGPFAEAELADALTDDTWRQWRMPWTATAGAHRLAVRCTDGDGQLQREARDEPLPDGASGWQSLLVTVRESS
ncbi:molybdopterin-dependent oxidoreductase [Acidimicrobiia bacterium EGI L10123]|uniref:molybdopterin-dependent oxidoreductase n=1 Tax=Salinilacustrithrix flava TaxID=2957203 RepID=UPI003D7C221C|nr:molybdopterin-dependent oxidoreductase [Acidimicrobiia bacterium EGI L10123]